MRGIEFEFDPALPGLEAYAAKALSQIRGEVYRYASVGELELASATPVRTGVTASSWTSRVHISDDGFEINWGNHNAIGEVPIVLLIVNGHSTGTGGYVPPNDFVTPAMRNVYADIDRSIVRAMQ